MASPAAQGKPSPLTEALALFSRVVNGVSAGCGLIGKRAEPHVILFGFVLSTLVCFPASATCVLEEHIMSGYEWMALVSGRDLGVVRSGNIAL